ncbi:hypothetical protein J4217_03290 [Candidatus Pacearchaeota archaeon]|nr:hypothetical protein [Candidatus Pacearchaeota archaeon]
MVLNKLEKTILTAGLAIGIGLMPLAATSYQNIMMNRAGGEHKMEKYEIHAQKMQIYKILTIGMDAILVLGYFSYLRNNLSKKPEE